jgi:glutathione S-transferase
VSGGGWGLDTLLQGANPVTDTKLYLFAISHYCEKARWALELYGIDYRPHFLMPGMNRPLAKKLGAENGSLPFLVTNGMVVPGSSAIIDWGEANRTDGRASLAGGDPEAVRALERRLDDVAGIHVRRFYYSDALLTMPGKVRPIFSRDLPLLPKLMLTLAWSKIVPKMIALMDLGTAQGLQSRDIVLGELDWLDGLLSDGRTYLTGDAMTRADITAASLLAPFVNPPKHPSYATLELPTALAETIKDWQDRPVLHWVRRLYADWRSSGPFGRAK